ncbi:hypothetical protein GH714_019290 [Hevea brasiliensis]|uniref:Uncharacterized protein n=1 Tax=Hevea brasiliensis TaxID=3981 RepID=A0A6A6KQ10_HEVBR|nr:hypothetical protein GH714_019290 [Hevea brasiliensis]
MFVTAIGTKGTLHVDDFVIPFNDKEAPSTTSSKSWFNNCDRVGMVAKPEHGLRRSPQEACMVREFARLVGNIKVNGAKPDQTWPTRSRKTQLILDAVKTSIERFLVPIPGFVLLGLKKDFSDGCASQSSSGTSSALVGSS